MSIRRRIVAAAVSVAVIGTLGALLKSGVDSVREAAARTDSI